MRLFWTRSKNVDVEWPYCLGLIFRKVARVADSTRNVWQVRLGLIWWHTGITFIF